MLRCLDLLNITGVSMQPQIPLPLKNPASEHVLHTSKFPITPPYSFKIFLDPRLFKLNPSFSPMFAGNVLFAYLFYKFV